MFMLVFLFNVSHLTSVTVLNLLLYMLQKNPTNDLRLDLLIASFLVSDVKQQLHQCLLFERQSIRHP